MDGLKPMPIVFTPKMIVVEDPDRTLPLEHTLVSAQITGPIAVVAVSQRFGNPLDEVVELEYLFPLPDDAVINGFSLHIGTRRIEGSLEEHETARADYEAALQSGKRAGLLEERRPNLFAVRLANVRPGETIHAELRYQQRLRFVEDAGGDDGGRYEFIFPMGLTPRYDSPDHPGEGDGVHAPIAQGEKIGPVEVNLSADMGFPIQKTTSPSHPIEVTAIDEQRVQVRLSGKHIPDHDFVLRFSRAVEESSVSAWTSGQGKQAAFLAVLIPPAMKGDPQPPQREFIFVLDRSGSMSGKPIQQARNALRASLRALNDGDTFSILLFDNRFEWFRGEPVPVTQANIDAADTYLDRVEGRGGTEIVQALDAALALPEDSRRERVIVFLTDGAVSAEGRLLENLRQKVGSARLFTFGVGPSVNRALISRMAALGRGRAQFLQLDEDIEGAIIRFQDSISFPALTDLNLTWQHGEGSEIYPARLPDLYYGEPLEICGRWSFAGRERSARLIVRGLCEGKPIEMSVDLPAPAHRDPALERIWAKARVDDLLEQMQLDPGRHKTLRKEIVRLALEHNLITPFTSYVAVDHAEEVAGGKPRLVRVAQPLPAGLEPGGFGRLGQVMSASVLPAAASGTVAFSRSAPDTANSYGAAPAALFRQDMNHAANVDRPIPLKRSLINRDGIQPDQPVASEPLSLLRWLGRTQNLDGSWEGDVEQTAAAVLAFLRAGHSPGKGSYRRLMRKAVSWLRNNNGDGWAAFARARALDILAQATGDPGDIAAASAALQQLPSPASPLEAAAVSGTSAEVHGVPDPLLTLDDLRLAGIAGIHRHVPEALLQGPQSNLALTWATGL